MTWLYLIFISSLHKECQLIHRDDIACRRCQNFWATSMDASSAMPNSCKSSWKTGRASEAFLARKLNAVKSKKEVYNRLQYSYTTWNMLQKNLFQNMLKQLGSCIQTGIYKANIWKKSVGISQKVFLTKIISASKKKRKIAHDSSPIKRPSVSSGAHSHKSCCCNPGSWNLMWWGGSWISYLQ